MSSSMSICKGLITSNNNKISNESILNKKTESKNKSKNKKINL